MTAPHPPEYRYTDLAGNTLLLVEAGHPGSPFVYLNTTPARPEDSLGVPVVDVPDVVLGILGQAAVTTGRDATALFTHMREDVQTLTNHTELWTSAHERLPTLLVLAEARILAAEAALGRAREFADTARAFTHHDHEFALYIRAMGDHLLRKLDGPRTTP